MPSLDHAACMLPDRARSLPESSLERLIASKCLRLYWHLIFDPCPRLLDYIPPDGKALFEPFLAWAEAHELAMEWPLHLHLLGFLRATAPQGMAADRDVIIEILAATASRWARTDLTADVGILLGSPLLPGEAVLAWKCSSLTEPKQVFLVSLGHDLPPEPAGWILLPTRADPAIQTGTRNWTYTLS